MQPMTPESCRKLLAQRHYAIVFPLDVIEDPRAGQLPREPLVPVGMRHPGDAQALPALVALEPGTPSFETLAQNLIDAHDGKCPANERAIALIASLIRVQPDTKSVELSSHLTGRLILSCQARKERGLLRYYQADTFLHLRRILRPPQLASLYGPIAEWTFPFQGQWISFPPPALDAEKDIIPLYWNVDGQTLDKIKEITRIGRVLDLYQEKHDYPWPDIAAYDHDARIAGDALIDAGAAGLCEERDIMAFAMHAIEYGPHFHWHPEIRAILETLNGESYQAASSRISPDCWRQIAPAG